MCVLVMHLMLYVLLETIAGLVNVQLDIQGIHILVAVEKVRNFTSRHWEINYIFVFILLVSHKFEILNYVTFST